MKLCEMAGKLGLELITPELAADGDREVTGGYASDLLSDVLAHGQGSTFTVSLPIRKGKGDFCEILCFPIV